MSATTFLFAALCAWLVMGIMCSYVMGRRGHDPWSWGVLGAMLGPLVVPLAIAATRRERAIGPIADLVQPGRTGSGPVSVLVGVDGSPESGAVARRVVDLFGPRLRRLTVATVIDFDAAEARSVTTVHVASPRQLLEAVAATVPETDPELVTLTGRPAPVLADYARDHGHDMVAVGARGTGLSTAVLGSVAEQLVQRGDVLVLIGAGAQTNASGPAPVEGHVA